MTTPPPVDLSSHGFHVQKWIGHWYRTLGDVYVARRNDATDHTIREIKHDLLKETDEIVHELAMLRYVRHPNLLECSSSFVHSDGIYIVTPSFPFGSMSDIVVAFYSTGIPEKAMSSVAFQTLKGLEYLHSKGIIHRGIRASHMLVDLNGKICLTGLRCSIQLPEGKGVTADFDNNLHTMLPWLAPEILQQNLSGYDQKTDIYSLGMALLEIGNGVVPFVDMPPLKMLYEKSLGTVPTLLDANTMRGKKTENTCKEHCSRIFASYTHDFIAQCVRNNQYTRPSSNELLQHQFTKSKRRNVLKYLPEAYTIHEVQRESTRPPMPSIDATDCPKWES